MTKPVVKPIITFAVAAALFVLFYFAMQPTISGLSEDHPLFGSIAAGFFAAACLLGLALFFIFGTHKKYLFFALFAAGASMLVLFTHAALPGIPATANAIGKYLCIIAMVATFALYMDRAFPQALNKWVLLLIYIYSAAFAVVSAIAPASIVSTIFVIYEICAIAFFVYILVMLLWGERKAKPDSLPAALGLGVLIAFYVIYKIADPGVNLVIAGMEVLASACVISLLLQFSMAVRATAIRDKTDADFAEAGKMVGRINRMKSDLLFNMPQDMDSALKSRADYNLLTGKRQISSSMDIMQRNLENIAVESNRLSLLAMRMLHITYEKQQPERKKIQLSKCAERAYDLYSPMFDKKRNTLTLETEAWLPAVGADESMIMQVILHMLTNANDRTQDGTVTMSVSRGPNKQSIAFSIHDTGAIIPQEEIAQLLDNSKKPDKDASGSGLFVSREIVEAYGGVFRIDSGAHTGTAVSFELPDFHDEDA